MKVKCSICLALWLLIIAVGNLSAQTLNLPARATNAFTGSQFANIIYDMSQNDRENWVLNEFSKGNIPGWMRNLVPVTISQTISGTPHTVTYYVAPDYLAIGSDQDYFLEPTSPILAQRIANLVNCTLPTRLMVNQIWTNSTVKLSPSTVNPTNNNNATVPVFILQDKAVMVLRNAVTNAHPLGSLVSGDKKDIVISTLIYSNLTAGVPKPVVIYGWIQPNGVPIQGEVNVHAESYMDYSHGVRLVQMSVILDGATNSVTNILTDPVLWPLLSDESSGTIAKPYYTVDNTIGPLILNQPGSLTVTPGNTATFSVNAMSDLPISYAWKSNGAAIAHATNATLVLTNVQPATAATYTVALNNAYGSATSIPAVLKVNTTAFPLLFSDNFETNSATNWNLFQGSGDGVSDYTVDWAFDYRATPFSFNGSVFLIPPAPNSSNGTTKGVRFTVNNNDTDAAISGVNIYPKGKTFSGNFALKFDLWLGYPGGPAGAGATGSTEYAIFGINHLGTEPNWGATSASSTDGIWFAVDGEGGTTGDYRAYLGNPSGVETLLAVGAASGLASGDNTNAIYTALFPPNRFETTGAPGKNWVAGEVSQTNNILTWKLDGTIVAQRSNTSSFTSGDVMLGYMDVFTSIASPTNDAFVIFDNVRVEDWSSPPMMAAIISSQPTNQFAYSGGNAVFSVTPDGTSPFAYQWAYNGTNVTGATDSSLSLSNVQMAGSGNYSVLVSNAVGSVISSSAQLTVIPPVQFSALTIANNTNFQFSFTGTTGIQYYIETSTDLITWTPLAAVSNNANPVVYTDTNFSSLIKRFYRVHP